MDLILILALAMMAAVTTGMIMVIVLDIREWIRNQNLPK
jgi:hypothetical protein